MKKTVIILVLTFNTFLSLAQQGLSDRDLEFINYAARAGLMEIKLGQLAQKKDTLVTTKYLGEQLLNDHTKISDELKALANKKGSLVPESLNKKERKFYRKFEKKQGKEFDKSYSKYIIKGHRKAISKFKEEAKKGDDAEIRAWAEKTVPTLIHHKRMVKESCQSLPKKLILIRTL